MCAEWKNSFLKFYEDMGPIPEGCDGIELIDLDKNFCKDNCRWVGKHNRRSVSEMPGNKKGKRTFKESAMVCIRVEKEYHKFLKKLAAAKAKQKGESYSVSQLIRDIVEEHAPMPTLKQLDMFGEEKS